MFCVDMYFLIFFSTRTPAIHEEFDSSITLHTLRLCCPTQTICCSCNTTPSLKVGAPPPLAPLPLMCGFTYFQNYLLYSDLLLTMVWYLEQYQNFFFSDLIHEELLRSQISMQFAQHPPRTTPAEESEDLPPQTM